MTYDFHPEARLEYREAAAFYDARRAGLGAAFTRSRSRDRSHPSEPKSWRVVEQDVRRCLTHTFPYGILYTIEEDLILIVAIMHLHRRPGYWRDRL